MEDGRSPEIDPRSSILSLHSFTPSLLHLVTLSPCHLVTLSPCHLVTLSPYQEVPVAKREDQAFQQRLEHLDGLLQAIEASADPAVRSSAREAIQTLMELHGAGLERILEIVAIGDAPASAIV